MSAHTGGTDRHLNHTLLHAPAIAAGHEEVLRELVDPGVRRVLDLGCGDGRLLAIALSRAPAASGVGLDFSESMLELARERFVGEPLASFVTHDLRDPLTDLGRFDLVISGFAIHHVDDDRKRSIYAEVLDLLEPGSLFVNIEQVASTSPRYHAEWMLAMGIERDDPSNLCAPLDTQLGWLRDLGYEDVDCLWKWREMALIAGRRPK